MENGLLCVMRGGGVILKEVIGVEQVKDEEGFWWRGVD